MYRVGDPCNLMVARLDEFEGQLHALLDCNAGFLVLHPDVLLSGAGAWGAGRGVRGPEGRLDAVVRGVRKHPLGDRWPRGGPLGAGACRGTGGCGPCRLRRLAGPGRVRRHRPAPLPRAAGTRITTSHDCVRRSVLEEWVGGTGTNDKAVKGTLQHLLIQASGWHGL